ncbi:hypothetical protein D7I43_20780 [Micromonospora globbae]|jgi:hypothetical protein|uniref:Uncharacterized protein n=1 Tax=Micromonospora globbae TaxID=1894969 RepID=A0A420EXR9_9ACTN|nr:hypothetical protein D7I43_20780 [Micromonospora globbae]
MATRRDQTSRANTPHPSPPTPPTRTTDGEAPTAHPDTDPPVLPGTLSMARYLTDPATETEIQALAAEAGLPTVDQAATLARLLRLHQPAPPRAA